MATINVERAAPGFWHTVMSGLAKGFEHRSRRKRFNRLLNLDDRMLEDIGVTRAEVIYASRLPLQHNAARVLDRMSNDRRRLDRLKLDV